MPGLFILTNHTVFNAWSQTAVYYRNGATSTDFMSEEALQEIIDKKMVVTYHANYAGNKGRKQEKLERFGLVQGFNVNKNVSSEQKK